VLLYWDSNTIDYLLLRLFAPQDSNIIDHLLLRLSNPHSSILKWIIHRIHDLGTNCKKGINPRTLSLTLTFECNWIRSQWTSGSTCPKLRTRRLCHPQFPYYVNYWWHCSINGSILGKLHICLGYFTPNNISPSCFGFVYVVTGIAISFINKRETYHWGAMNPTEGNRNAPLSSTQLTSINDNN